MARDNGVITLWLNRYFQFDTVSEKIYHESLVSLPLAMARRAETVLVMGGGDGLALREALRFPSVKRIVWLELDPEMVKFAQSDPMVALNENSTRNPRVKLLLGDAKANLGRIPDAVFDVVIGDFPAATSKDLEALIEFSFIDQMLAKMRPGGVFATQVSESFNYQTSLREYLKGRLGHAASLLVTSQGTLSQLKTRSVEYDIDIHRFTYGSTSPFAFRRRIPTNGPIGRSDRKVTSLISLKSVSSFVEAP